MEFIYILEHHEILFSGIQEIQTQSCAPTQCTVWPRNDIYALSVFLSSHFVAFLTNCCDTTIKKHPWLELISKQVFTCQLFLFSYRVLKIAYFATLRQLTRDVLLFYNTLELRINAFQLELIRDAKHFL